MDRFTFYVLRTVFVAMMVVGATFLGVWGHFGSALLCWLMSEGVRRLLRFHFPRALMEAGQMEKILAGPHPWGYLLYYSLTLSATFNLGLGILRTLLKPLVS